MRVANMFRVAQLLVLRALALYTLRYALLFGAKHPLAHGRVHVPGVWWRFRAATSLAVRHGPLCFQKMRCVTTDDA